MPRSCSVVKRSLNSSLVVVVSSWLTSSNGARNKRPAHASDHGENTRRKHKHAASHLPAPLRSLDRLGLIERTVVMCSFDLYRNRAEKICRRDHPRFAADTRITYATNIRTYTQQQRQHIVSESRQTKNKFTLCLFVHKRRNDVSFNCRGRNAIYERSRRVWRCGTERRSRRRDLS